MNKIKEILEASTQKGVTTRYSNFNSNSTKIKLSQLSVSSTIKLEVLNAAGFVQTVYMDYSTFVDLKNTLDDWFKTEETVKLILDEFITKVVFSGHYLEDTTHELLENIYDELTEEYVVDTPEELIEDGEIQREDTVDKDESSMPN